MRDRYEGHSTQRAGARGYRKVRKGSWVVAVMADTDPAEPRPHFHCQRCGERLITILPIEISVFVAMGNAFVKSHSGCAERRTG